MSTPSAVVSYTSDGRNLRQSRTVGAVTQQFSWSSVGGLPLLLDDGEHSFLCGPSSTPLAQVDDTTGEAQYLHADLLGTPRLVTDATGGVVGTASFDAFGSRTTGTGIQSVFGFTGNLVDAVTGLLYLRARDYDPATGQFLSVDPAVDQTRQPYAYTGNSPVQRTDPTGRDWQEELLAVGAGALDGLTGGASSMLMSAFVPGYDCFIQEHNTAFQVGSIVTQVAVAVVMIVGTAGAGAVLVAAKYAAIVGIKVALKTALKEARQLVASTARRLLGGSDNVAGAAASRTTAQTVERAAVHGADDAVVSITQRYARPNGATTAAQRESVQGLPCVECGDITRRQVADHIDPLVSEYYRTGTIDQVRMRTIEAVQAQCPTCSARQGGLLSWFSRQMRQTFGL